MRDPGQPSRLRYRAWIPVLFAAAALTLACDVSTPTEIRVEPWSGFGQLQVQRISGDGQSGAAGQPLAAPFVLRVVDPQGRAVSGVTVMWTVIEGDGRLPGEGARPPGSRYDTVSDEAGMTSVTFTLGPTAGRHVVEAGPVLSGWRVRFEATARPAG